jgi:hypothetical protein
VAVLPAFFVAATGDATAGEANSSSVKPADAARRRGRALIEPREIFG